jgi:rhomboid protease GluP
MEIETARIPARSRREAMDWSLVLLSQGIEPVIDYAEDTAAWGLVVPADNFESAQEAIHLYQLENRRWPWRREVFRAGLLFDWGSLAWAALLVFFYWTDNRIDLRSAGIMDSVAASHGEWWRLFTAVWLHADLAHLASNTAIGFVLLGLTMARYGTGAGLLGAYLAGAGGNVVVWVLSPGSPLSLGASGMVMGALGLLAIQSLPLPRGADGHLITGTGASAPAGVPRSAVRAARLVVTGVLGGVLLFVLLGLAPGTDVVAHAGGFLSGIILGGLLKPVPRLSQKAKTNLLCGVVFVALVLWPWWLALRRR